MRVDWREPVDMLFIDTDHTFDHTLMELKKYEPLTVKLVIMHDSVHTHAVREAAAEYFDSRPGYRIYEYVNNNGLLVIFR